jgi:hypothetical protein
MYKLITGIAFGLLLFSGTAMATCSSYPYSLTNGTTADASQVMANFNCSALTSGATLVNVSQIGIGMASPSYPLDVEGGSSAGATIARFDATTASSSGAGLRVSYSGTTEGWIGYAGFGVQFPSATTGDFGIGSRARIGMDSGGASYPVVLALSGASVGIGTASPSYTLHVNGSVAGTSAYVNLSDARLKKNIVPLSDGLALVGQLRAVRFDWRTEDEREVGKEFKLSADRQIGFIAQDVAKVLPEAVSTAKGKDAIMSLAESKIVPALVSAVQEQEAEIRALKAANDNQVSEIHHLHAQLEELERQTRIRTAQR